MLFSSLPFIYFFLPAVVIVYFVSPKKLKNAVLLLSSLIFYAWGEKLLALLFMASIMFGWLLGFLIDKTRGSFLSKLFLAISVVADILLLGYFKYSDFFISNFNAVFKTDIPLLKVALPIGISFYLFQIMSYTIDVYRGDVPPQKNPIDFAAYISFFPQLIAGPIVRYSDIASQLKNRTHSIEKISGGITRFCIGLAKKILIANVVGEISTSFRSSADISVLYYWLYAVSFMIQIYFDFSGYSDMAIGLGKIFGFDFIENFNYPYISSSITEFWRRWHISLGSWFRDYVYIPLGGNRKGRARQLLNIFIVWMLTGLWHGSAWNFVLWGLLYAVLLTIEKIGLKKILDKCKPLGIVYVLFVTLLGFVLFNADSLATCAADISGLFAFGRLPLVSNEAVYMLRSYLVPLLIGCVGATPVVSSLVKKIKTTTFGNKVSVVFEPIFVVAVLIIVTAYLVDGSFNPFLYFRF